MNDIQGYQNGPIETGASRAKEMSPRAYNLVMSALIFLGFCAMGAGAYFTSTMAFARMMMSGAALPLVFGSFILTIVGIVMMSAAAGKQSVGLSLTGYVIFASTFGLTASFGLANYDLPTINTAFIATAAITRQSVVSKCCVIIIDSRTNTKSCNDSGDAHKSNTTYSSLNSISF